MQVKGGSEYLVKHIWVNCLILASIQAYDIWTSWAIIYYFSAFPESESGLIDQRYRKIFYNADSF